MLVSNRRRASGGSAIRRLFKTSRRKAGAFSLALLLTLGVLAALPGLALAAVIITEFTIPTANSSPRVITSGPDGNLWFVEQNGNQIGRITTAGGITEFAVPTIGSLLGITTGPDGNLWFTEGGGNQIGRITLAGVITEFAVPTAGSTPFGITSGPDGNLWFVEQSGNKIGRITTAGVVTEFAIPTANSNPLGITTGPDGNLWFTEELGNKIGRITPAGVITEFPIPTAVSGPYNIITGPNGNLWFTEDSGNQIGQITTAGVITEFAIPTAGSFPLGITGGSDGNIWFAEQMGNQIGRITPAGVITEFPIPTANSQPSGITNGPDGNIWFVEQSANKIGKLAQVLPPTLSVGFGAVSIPVGSTTSLTFTITNPNASTALTGLAFSANLPVGLVVATPSGLTSTCVEASPNTVGGSSITQHGSIQANAVTAGSSNISLSATTLAANTSCTVTVDVLANTVGTFYLTVSGAGVITAIETGDGVASNTATLTITALGTPVVPLPAAPPKPNASPADIVAQLRVKPDRLASTDPTNLISYSLSVKNIGPGKANSASVRFPIDPNLLVGYAADLSDSRMWVSAIVTGVPQPYIQINLPSLETNSTPLTLTLVFRPAATAQAGTSIFSRYQVLFDDDTGSGKQQLSNAVRFSLTSDGNRDDTGGAVELFNPATATVAVGGKLTIGGDFYIPNEIVSLWYTAKDGTSVALGQQAADQDGKLSFDFSAGSDLKPGEVYTVVGYGNRSGISGSSVVTVAAS